MVTSCHNCVDGLGDIIKHYGLDMEVKQLVDLVADALVLEKPAAIPAEKPAAAAALAGYKILIADDEPDMRVFLRTVLEDNGATVFEAANGNEAIEIARTEKPHLMTLDLAMPGKDGGETYDIIRKDKSLSDVAVCIVTGRPELRKTIYDRDVPRPQGYLDKPVSEKDIMVNVRKILELAEDA